MRLDATRRFPFADGTYDYVYSEHMIEHVSYESGLYMMRECNRILKPGGVLRLVTPDLDRILALRGPAPSDLQNQYLTYFMATFLPPTQPHTAIGAINAHFRLWGHTFLYDEITLADAMTAAGFNRIERLPLTFSSHADLCAIARDGRYPEGLLEYESLTMEGTK